MVAIVENIWDQILRNDVLKEDHISKHRLQTALKAFPYNYLDIDYKEFGFDQKRINTILDLFLYKNNVPKASHYSTFYFLRYPRPRYVK